MAGNLGTIPLRPRIAASPDGNDVWIACIGNNGDGTPEFDSTYYPIFFRSIDAGQTWGAPIAVTIDGPNGLPAVLNFISDYRLELTFGQGQVPPRDQIAYSTAFDCDLVVDFCSVPHLGVGIHLAGNAAFTVATGDSLFAIFDISSYDRGISWCARAVGWPKKFRGYFPASQNISEDNRVNAAITKDGKKLFFSWLDSQGQADTANDHPDVFARGYDMLTNELTNSNGLDQGTNVTASSSVSASAWFGDIPYYIFMNTNGTFTIPIATETICGGDIISNPVSFNYIPDFSFTPNQFTIDANGPPWGGFCMYCYTGISEKHESHSDIIININPNPARENVNLILAIPETGAVIIDLFSFLGQSVIHRECSFLTPGEHSVNLDISNLKPGIYFYTVTEGSQRASGKLLVE